MSRSRSALLLVFVRNLVKGKVKRRLAAVLGEDEALRIYTQLLHLTQAATAALRTEKWVYYSDYIPKSDLFDRGGFLRRLQKGGDLGERMQLAFAEGFEAGHAPVLIIGSDCPGLSTTHVEAALAALKKRPYVLGPAQDGGYYLLGMCVPRPSLFVEMPWGGEEVCDLTLHRLPAGSYYLLPKLQDIDRVEDLPTLPPANL